VLLRCTRRSHAAGAGGVAAFGGEQLSRRRDSRGRISGKAAVPAAAAPAAPFTRLQQQGGRSDRIKSSSGPGVPRDGRNPADAGSPRLPKCTKTGHVIDSDRVIATRGDPAATRGRVVRRPAC